MSNTYIPEVTTYTQRPSKERFPSKADKIILPLGALALATLSILGINALTSHDTTPTDTITVVADDHSTFATLATEVPGYSEEDTNPNKLIHTVRSLNPDIKDNEIRPGMTIVLPAHVE